MLVACVFQICDMMTMRDEYVNIMLSYADADTVVVLSLCDQPRLKMLCVQMRDVETIIILMSI